MRNFAPKTAQYAEFLKVFLCAFLPRTLARAGLDDVVLGSHRAIGAWLLGSHLFVLGGAS